MKDNDNTIFFGDDNDIETEKLVRDVHRTEAPNRKSVIKQSRAALALVRRQQFDQRTTIIL